MRLELQPLARGLATERRVSVRRCATASVGVCEHARRQGLRAQRASLVVTDDGAARSRRRPRGAQDGVHAAAPLQRDDHRRARRRVSECNDHRRARRRVARAVRQLHADAARRRRVPLEELLAVGHAACRRDVGRQQLSAARARLSSRRTGEWRVVARRVRALLLVAVLAVRREQRLLVARLVL